MRKPIAQRIRGLEERKKTLQARLDKQERAQSTRGKMLLEWFVLEQLERNEQCGHREDLRQCADVRGRAGATLAAARSFRTSTLRSFGHSMAPAVPAIGKKTESEIQPEIKNH